MRKKNKPFYGYKKSRKKKQDYLKKKLGSWYHIIKDIEDWDYVYCLELEYHYLIRLRDCIKRNNRFVSCNRTCERMQTLINMLDIIRNGTMVIERIQLYNPIGKDGLWDPDAITWKANRYVNIRNASRFVNNTILEHIKNSKDDLWIDTVYQEKIWKLYHKFRETWMRTFWD